MEKYKLSPFNGILADLGVSSKQFDDMTRGFSFKSESLDMRMDVREEENALDLINSLAENELADIFYQYGEERRSRQISAVICAHRRKEKITSGVMLASLVEKAKRKTGRIHPATNVFQALRIYVNRELENLEKLLAALDKGLLSGGRAVILTYHSLEDRIAKRAFRSYKDEGKFKLLNKKVVVASREEIKRNPRARSAKLRAVERI